MSPSRGPMGPIADFDWPRRLSMHVGDPLSACDLRGLVSDLQGHGLCAALFDGIRSGTLRVRDWRWMDWCVLCLGRDGGIGDRPYAVALWGGKGIFG